MFDSPWTSLEELPSLIALLPIWRDMLGDNFAAFSSLCLAISSRVARHYPCPHAPWCAYRIYHNSDNSITGECEHPPAECDYPHVQFTEDDVTPLELDWQKLGRSLCRALNLDYKFRGMFDL